MKLIVLGSSSSGNCYILDNGKEALIIEAGIRFQEVKKALDFNLRKVVGCVVTHAHNDHAKYIKAIVDFTRWHYGRYGLQRAFGIPVLWWLKRAKAIRWVILRYFLFLLAMMCHVSAI